jgi:hypothetical protein
LSKKTSSFYYNIIAIKWGESTHFPGQTGNQGETTRIRTKRVPSHIYTPGMKCYFWGSAKFSVLARISKGQGATSEKDTFMHKRWLKKGTLMCKD